MTPEDTATNLLKQCMNIQPHETLLIITDTQTPKPITISLFKAGSKLASETLLTCMQPRKNHGEEPPQAITSAMENADVILAPTTKSLTHTKARRQASNKGARIATMPGLTTQMMTHGGLLADYQQIHKNAETLLAQLKDSKEIRLTTPLGTDITFDVTKQPWKADTGIAHKPGEYTNLPAGEVFIAPTNAKGTFIIDATMGGIGKLDKPLKFTAKNRYVTKIEGSKAEQLTQQLTPLSPDSYNIAEFGIGLNPQSKIIGIVLEDEKVKNTTHIALGNNKAFGGETETPLHLDGIITQPTIYIDGKKLTQL